jgi:hypothetical protein
VTVVFSIQKAAVAGQHVTLDTPIVKEPLIGPELLPARRGIRKVHDYFGRQLGTGGGLRRCVTKSAAHSKAREQAGTELASIHKF